MAIRTLKPTSPARRYLTYVTSEEITRTTPEKGLVIPKTRTSGRNRACFWPFSTPSPFLA